MTTRRPFQETPTQQSPAVPALTLSKLAHELNSLLDGSMRSVRLALAALDGTSEISDAGGLLRDATTTMGDMASLLDRAMAAPTLDPGVLALDTTIAGMVDRVVGCVRPAAAEAGVELIVDVPADLGTMPSGALGSLVLNGLRNAIEACRVPRLLQRRIELTFALADNDAELRITIIDTGRGLPRTPRPDGHGLGLPICRQIVDSLGGRLSVTNVPFGRGTVLEASIPVASLEGE
jgi:signal transduction histidine kinase